MAIYYVYSGAGGSNNGSSWANAFTTLVTAFATEAAGDTLFVAHDHAESSGALLTLTSSGSFASPTKVICVNRSGSVPPVSADRRATAAVSTSGAFAINFNGNTHYDGIIFTSGAGGATANSMTMPNTLGQSLRFDNCSLRINGTTATNAISIGGSSTSGQYIEWNNTTVSFIATGHAIIFRGGTLRWRNTPSALLGTMPTTLFQFNLLQAGVIECIGVDFSAAGSGKTIVSYTSAGAITPIFKAVDCKLNASVTKAGVPTSHSQEVDFIRSGSSGVNYTVYRTRISGELLEETTIVRTGGASDGTTSIAWKVVTTANCTYSLPFETPPIAIWNDTTGSAVTATVEGIWGGGAVPLDDEVFIEVQYLGDASSPLASFVNDGKADLLATAANQTSSSETWGGSTTKFKLGVTFTPQQKGWIYARIKCAKASSTFYIDPLVTLT